MLADMELCSALALSSLAVAADSALHGYTHSDSPGVVEQHILRDSESWKTYSLTILFSFTCFKGGAPICCTTRFTRPLLVRRRNNRSGGRIRRGTSYVALTLYTYETGLTSVGLSGVRARS